MMQTYLHSPKTAVIQANTRLLQRKAIGQGQVSSVPPIVHDVLQSTGQPLDAKTRAFFEPRFGMDFSAVTVHTDVQANDSAGAVNALAYTVGRDIIFAAGQFSPHTTSGRCLLAHELTHVMQQGSSAPSRTLEIGETGSHAEAEAENISRIAFSEKALPRVGVHTSPLIQRQGPRDAWEQDLQQRASRVRSLSRTGTARIALFQDAASGKLSGYQIHQAFTLELAAAARASDYAIVQWIKGDLYEQRGTTRVYWPANTGLYGKSPTQPWHFTDWVIDSPDADPRFGSDRGLTVQVPTTNFDDNPGIIMQTGHGPLPANLHWAVDARVGVYPWGTRIPTTISGWESSRPTPFREVRWGWDITVTPDQLSLDVNFQ